MTTNNTAGNTTAIAENEPQSDYVAATTTAEETDPGADAGVGAATMMSPTSTTYNSRPRTSQLFMGVCDMRTAVVALDVLHIVYSLLVALILAIMLLCQGNSLFLFRNLLAILTGGLITASVSGLGLWSAMQWHTTGLWCATVLFGVIFVWRCLVLEWIDMMVTALLLYPHIVLLVEIRSGVLSETTFTQEEYILPGGRDFVDMAHDYLSPQNSMV